MKYALFLQILMRAGLDDAGAGWTSAKNADGHCPMFAAFIFHGASSTSSQCRGRCLVDIEPCGLDSSGPQWTSVEDAAIVGYRLLLKIRGVLEVGRPCSNCYPGPE